jgi:hypothetical protein
MTFCGQIQGFRRVARRAAFGAELPMHKATMPAVAPYPLLPGARNLGLLAAPIDRRSSRNFFIIGVPRDSESLADRHPTGAQLDGVRRFVEQLLAEDDPVLNTMRFRVGVLTASDPTWQATSNTVAAFPRGEVPE